MKTLTVTPGKNVYLNYYKWFKGNPKGKVVLTDKNGQTSEVANAAKFFERMAVFTIPSSEIVGDDLPITVKLQVSTDNGPYTTIEEVSLSAQVPDSDGGESIPGPPGPPGPKGDPGDKGDPGKDTVRHWLEGVNLWVYGSSFTVDPGFSSTAGMEWHKLTKDRLRMKWGANTGGVTPTDITTYGASGKSIRDTAKRIIGGMGVANAQWTPARKGIAVIDTWVNDLGAYGLVSGQYVPRAFVAKDITGIKGNLRGALAYISAGTILENTVGVKGGTWAADGAVSDRSGGNNSVTSTAGATMTFSNVSVPENHFFYLCHVLEPNSFSTAPVEVLVDGVVAKSIPATDFHCHSSVEGGTITTGSAAFKINTTPGTHTVVIRHAGTTGQNMLVDALVVPKPVAQRNPVFIVQDALPRGVVGGAFYKPADIPTLENNWPQLLTAYNEVLADFPNAVFIETTLNAAVDYGADGLHPNDRGMIRKADELTEAISEWFDTNRPDSLFAV